jgi:DNA-binding transcriptional regulator YdaS (Cro superfamily)
MRLDIFLQSIKMDHVQFGKIIGYNGTYLREINKGKYRPSLRLCHAIEKATYGKVTVKELRGEDPVKPSMRELVESL